MQKHSSIFMTIVEYIMSFIILVIIMENGMDS